MCGYTTVWFITLLGECRHLLLMTNTAFGQFRLGFFMTVLAEGMGGIFEGAELFGHAGLAVMAGFAFFDLLAFDVIDFFAVWSLAVMTYLALHSTLMCGMGELGGFGGGGRIDGGLQGDFGRSLVGGNGHSGHRGSACTEQ